ncbi:MAG: NADPH-dependent FMN reductase [Steroidobacteraceae bacterium]
MRILAISGSLRAASINSAFCRATAALAPPHVQVDVLAGLGTLPWFNQDLEASPPAAIQALRAAIHNASALVIASPEYAHGISGVMKNALDWLVSDEGTVGKPIALVNTSARAQHAYGALREVLATMSTDIVGPASLTLPLLGTCTTERAMVGSPEVSRAITGMIEALVLHVSGQSVPAVNFPLA